MPKRVLSPIWFVLIVGAFFLPFTTISCQAPPGLAEGLGGLGGEAGQIPSGGFEISAQTLDFVVGGEPSFSGSEDWQRIIAEQAGSQTPDKVKVEPFAIIALGLAALGIFLSLLPGRMGGILMIVLGAGAALFTFLLKSEVDKQLQLGDIPQQAAGFLKISNGLGYLGPIILGLVAAAWGVMRLVTERTPGMPMAPAYGGTAPPTTESRPAPPPGGTPPLGSPPEGGGMPPG